MVPRPPGQTRAIGAKTGRSIEIIALHQHDAGAACLHIQAHNGVHCLSTSGMVFPYAVHESAGAVNRSVGVAESGRRCKGARLSTRPLPVEALIGEVGELYYAVGNGNGSTAVLMGSCPSVAGGRCDIERITVARSSDHHIPPAF
jgi:hypothetical protein